MSVAVAMLGVHIGLVYRFNNTNSVPPQPGSYWRIDFSRVEWKVRCLALLFLSCLLTSSFETGSEPQLFVSNDDVYCVAVLLLFY